MVRISNIVIVDGTGAPPYLGEVLVTGNRIARVRRGGICSDEGVTIDGGGGFLTPGFIDTHSHTDLAPFLEEGMRQKIMQGITSEVTGVCGLGVAPVTALERPGFRRRLIFGDPGAPWNWERFDEYLSALRTRRLEHNLIPFAPHGVLRQFVAPLSTGPLTTNERDALTQALEECFAAGAVGVSMGRIYLPALFADQDELQRVFDVAAAHGRMVAVHMRSESDEIVEAMDELIRLAGKHPEVLHVSHLKVIGERNSAKLKELFTRIDHHGLSFDQYPFNFGSTTLLSLIPPHIFAHKSLPEVLLTLSEESVIQEVELILSEARSLPPGTPWDNLPALVGWENIVITDLQHETSLIGLSMAKASADRGISPVRFLLGLLQREGGNVRMTDRYMEEQLVEAIFLHDGSMVGTDSLPGGIPHPRNYGSFPKIINDFVFKRKLISLESAVAKMTSVPARRLGLTDRGVIREGAIADLALFGPDFHLPRSESEHTGLRFLFVGGAMKVADGEYRDIRSGSLLLQGSGAGGVPQS
ncbi:amidohydrolase family protein [Myxococcota bacterium]|nr:amidohydrolase family protein [Myxococcota bacterium]MBU1533719.1 amidohydrolase family protein [Myxococcota bacterium]